MLDFYPNIDYSNSFKLVEDNNEDSDKLFWVDRSLDIVFSREYSHIVERDGFMSLPKRFQTTQQSYLEHFLILTDTHDKLPDHLNAKIEHAKTEWQSGPLDELAFEQLIFELVCEFDEHMFAWKRYLKSRASDFLRLGPQNLYIMSAPDVKTCIKDIITLQGLYFPPSYSFEVKRKDNSYHLSVSYKGFDSPAPYVKDDTAMSFMLFLFKEVCGHEFDYSELLVPASREIFDETLVKQSTNATIRRHNGPMTAVIPESLYERKNPFYNELIRNSSGKAVEALVAELTNQMTFTDKVAQILSQSEQPAALTMEKVASALNKSVSTFRRNLAEENTSYKELQGKILDQITIESLLNTDIKIDALALKLGYAERSTFERAFRKKFGTTPSNIRAYRERLTSGNDKLDLQKIVQSLPPLPESCRQLIEQGGDENFDVSKAVKIIENDPVFSGRVMGLANKSIYGRSPKDLTEAISRNLGLATIKNLAVVFGAKESLGKQIKGLDIDKFIQAQIISPHIFRAYTKSILGRDYSDEITSQILMFGLLGFLVLCHKQHDKCDYVLEKFNASDNLLNFIHMLNAEMNLTVFGTSVVLLSLWGLHPDLIKFIGQFEEKISKLKALRQTEEIIFITFATSLSLCFDIDYKDSLAAHAENIRGMDFEDCWSQAEEIHNKMTKSV